MQNEGPCGPSIAETIISLAPESLSTARGAKNDPYPFDFSDLNHAIVNGSKIPLVPWDAYQGMFWCWDFGGCPVILDNYRPYISNPPQLLDLDPHWSTCSLFTGAIFDPPIALSTAAILDAPMPKTTSNKPSMTYHTTKAPAPGHTRSTTILPATTPIADSKPMPTPGSGNGGGNSGSGGGSNSDGRPGSHSGSGGLGSGGVGDSGSNNNGGLVGALTSAILGAASARPTAVAHGGGFGDSGQSGSGSGSGGDHAAPVPIATIGSHTVFSNPSGSGGSSNDGGPGGIIIDGHTFSAGDSGTTIGGVAISVGSSGLEVASGDAKTQTIAIPGSGSGLATLPPVITIGSSKITASINEVSGTAEPFYEIGGRTLTPGGTVTLGSGSSATTVALPNANNAAKPLIVVINGRTSTLAPEVVPITADTGASDERELITVAGTTYTANSVDQFVITDKDGTVHTLVPGKGTQTIDGTPIALLPGGLAVIGSSTASLSEVKVDPTNRGGSGRSSTAKSTLTTAEEGSSTYVPLASSTSGAAAGTGVGTPAWLPLVAAIGMLQLT